jgi:hypothetical protein
MHVAQSLKELGVKYYWNRNTVSKNTPPPAYTVCQCVRLVMRSPPPDPKRAEFPYNSSR